MNQRRSNALMGDRELAEVQSQTAMFFKARATELDGREPLLLGHDLPQHSIAATAESYAPVQMDPAMINSHIAAMTTEAGWKTGFSEVAGHVLEFLAEMGVPVAAVSARGAAAL